MPPHILYWGGGGGGGNGMFVPPTFCPHFYFPLELYVDITLTNNYLAFFIYQLIILWTILIREISNIQNGINLQQKHYKK